jgi:hypothetical protein
LSAAVRDEYLRERKKTVYENLRDLNFEYAAGKVPDVDYASLNLLCRMKPPCCWPSSIAWKQIPRRQSDGAQIDAQKTDAPKFERRTRVKTLLHVVLRKCSLSEKAETGREVAAPLGRDKGRGACLRVVLIVLLLTSFAAAQTFTGKVKNSTTGKPSVGDEVIFFKLGRGMEESGRAKTDAEGRFSFKLDDPQLPHLVRAIHQGVTYHRVALPGTTTVSMEVSDVAKRVDGIQVVADIMRIQAAQGHILVTRDFGVRNKSNPPRTQMNERNLEFYVPDGAHVMVDSATAASENGAPLKSAPVAESEKNRYSFIFPLRPGFTHFEVAYQLPYSGSVRLDPKSIYPLQSFAVITPKSMQFHAAPGSTGFKLMNYPNQPDASVRVAANIKGGQKLAFNISGEGPIPTAEQSATQRSGGTETKSAGASALRAYSNNRPGVGLGTPIDAPDSLHKSQLRIFGGAAAVLLIGGVFIAWRQQTKRRAFSRQRDTTCLVVALQNEGYAAPDAAGILESTKAPVVARPAAKLMGGIKEELSQLEMERKQGQISQAEYQNAKIALDQTLDRALKREAQRITAQEFRKRFAGSWIEGTRDNTNRSPHRHA